jgi:hypothetical protein
MDWLFAVLTFEDSRGLFGPLFLRGRVVHSARTGKVDGRLDAIAHHPEYTLSSRQSQPGTLPQSN